MYGIADLRIFPNNARMKRQLGVAFDTRMQSRL